MSGVGYKGRLGLLLAAQVAALVAVALFVYRPAAGGVERALQEQDHLKQRRSELYAFLETKPNPRVSAERARAEIRRLENRMPSESRIRWLSARIAEAMHAHNVDLRSATNWVVRKDRSAPPELKRLEKSVTVSCTARDLEALLESINRLPFVVIVEDLEVRREENWGEVSATIRMATFVLRARKHDVAIAATGTGS